MPSLHIAHALYMTMCAMGSRRLFWLGGIYVPTLLFLIVEASASGWHYLLDLPVGAVLAVLIFVTLTSSMKKYRAALLLTGAGKAPQVQREHD